MWSTLLLAASLATTDARADEPLTLSLVGAEVESAGLRETRLQLLAEVERTRWPPVRLREISYVLTIGGQTVATGEASYQGLELRRGEPQQVRVPVSFRTLEAAGALGKDLVQGGRIDVQLEGELRLRMLLFPVVVPLDEQLVDVALTL